VVEKSTKEKIHLASDQHLGASSSECRSRSRGPNHKSSNFTIESLSESARPRTVLLLILPFMETYHAPLKRQRRYLTMPLNEAIRSRTQSLVLTLNGYRFLLYTLLSTLAVSTAIGNALRTHSNFYSVAIYLSKSNRSVLVSQRSSGRVLTWDLSLLLQILANFGFILVLLCGRVVQQIFFGALRPLEVEVCQYYACVFLQF
jgi:hypothetical protein